MIHPVISLDKVQVEKEYYQKHLCLFLDKKLAFNYHIGKTLYKVDTATAVTKKLSHALPQKTLLAFYKVFLRPLIYHRNLIYDQPLNT